MGIFGKYKNPVITLRYSEAYGSYMVYSDANPLHWTLTRDEKVAHFLFDQAVKIQAGEITFGLRILKESQK